MLARQPTDFLNHCTTLTLFVWLELHFTSVVSSGLPITPMVTSSSCSTTTVTVGSTCTSAVTNSSSHDAIVSHDFMGSV